MARRFARQSRGPRRRLPSASPSCAGTPEVGQKLTSQILQTNGNEHDIRAGGDTCFGDSGGPAMHGGFLVADTSFGFTNNCRYLGGYQRVDIPVVRNWLLDCTAGPDLPHEGIAVRRSAYGEAGGVA